MDAEKSTARDEADLSRLLSELRAAGRKPDRALLDRVKSYVSLARLAGEAGDLEEARRRYESVLRQAPGSRMSRDERQYYLDAAVEELAELVGPAGKPLFAQLAVRRAYMEGPGGRRAERDALRHPPQATRKVGRNDPCPCGSGKKYKKCHGR